MPMHTLLQSQLKKCASQDGGLDVEALLRLVSEAYVASDRDRKRTDRSIGLMVEELEGLNHDLQRSIASQSAELDAARIALDATLQNTSQGFLVVDERQRVIAYNNLTMELLNLPTEVLDAKPKFADLIRFQQTLSEFSDMPADLRKMGVGSGDIRAAPALYERTRPDGRVLEIRTVLLKSGGAVRTYTDVTNTRQQLAALQQAEKLHRSLFENSAAGLYRSSMDGNVINANAAVARMHGYACIETFIEAMNRDAEWRYVEDGLRDTFRRRLIDDGRVLDFIAEIIHKPSGRRIWTAETAWLVRDASGTPVYYEGSIVDVSERKAAEDRILHQAMHDSLTGLHNRGYLMGWLRANVGETGLARNVAIHCVDLDRFKEVNDSLGHAGGDMLLKIVSQRMSRLLRSGDFAVRLGGDEFAIIQLGVENPRAAARLAARVVRALSEDFNLAGKTAAIGASIGIAFGSFNDATGEELLKNADVALYLAKSAGGNCVRIYDAGIDADTNRRRKIAGDLKTAIDESQFMLVYQPILSLRRGEIENYEALIRWSHPGEGAISPADFIPIAEESDLINPIGEWVLRQACETFAQSGSLACVSVNLSPAQLRQRGFVRTVVNTLASTGLAPHRLTLEITETVLLSDNSTTRSTLRELRALGVKIALDDFGTGHSSLSYLKKYDFDKIKIDRSFISGTDRSRINNAVISAVIGLGRDLDIEVIAEGIETEDQLAYLRSLGCDSIQGYFIGMPSPKEAWPELAARVVEQKPEEPSELPRELLALLA